MMRTTNAEDSVISAAVDRLRSLGFFVDTRAQLPTSDADVVLNLQRADASVSLEGYVRRHVRREIVGTLMPHHRARDRRRLLIAELVTQAVADELRRAGIQFIDTAGNAYLDAPGLFVWVSGKTAGKARPRLGIGRPAPTRVLFTLLSQPTLMNAPVRRVADASGVSLGAAQGAIQTLLARNEIVEVRGRRRFANPSALAKKWPEMYAEHLRPHLELGRFRSPNESWWAEVDLRPCNAVWSGEVAASKMGTLLRPVSATIFTDTIPKELVLHHRLAADKAGSVTFYRRFWTWSALEDSSDLAPPLLVYADLLTNGDARSFEAAGQVFDTHVLRSLSPS